ncbi:Arginase/deacetylase [Lojkania enalia]|uniref:Arginase/deacetylase n=1 Tax=Lojkania enalia TaxID=147567 RepID=A0A9P4K6L4_9PLEO|nr:Arginase/deacetylase [Didymosphaeria enalia]
MPGTPRASVSRRSSFNPNMPSPIGSKSPLPPPVEEKLPLRACDVAEEYFRKELALHEGMTGSATAGTVVIVHDQCYGHRYSRPKTSKSTLNMIVERPERILASVLGISAAYVRLGERHAEGSNAPHPNRNPSDRIPFRICKTSRVVDITSSVVTNVHGVKWMEELKAMCVNAERKLAFSGKELSREGPTLPGQPPKEKFHEGDLYLCSESLNAFQGALGGVLDAVDAVFQGTSIGGGPSRAFVCVRPPGHHCSADFPSGFCWINNVHIGIEHAMMQYGLTHAAIIDFDLHHGDGSQAITWARNKKVQNMSKNTANAKKTSIGYFSLHDINSFPCEWGDDEKVQAASICVDNAHGQSIWNVHLEGWKTQNEFWEKYEDKYMVLIHKTRQYLKHHTSRLRNSPSHPAPKAAIFVSAGFDASEWETEGMQRHKVNVPTEFYARFTKDVVHLAEEEGTGVDGRIISVLEGGYSDRALSSGILSHISGLCDGQVWSLPSTANGLGHEMSRRIGGLSMQEEDIPMPSVEPEATAVTYDPIWWHESQLLELENLVNPPPPVAPKKPARTGPPPTYSSPTQSFTAKVVDPSKIHRSISGKYMSTSPSRAPTPPPPEVDWATAAHALSKFCKIEELSEPKAKKEKTTVAPVPPRVDMSGRQLRGRKPVTSYADPDSDEDKIPVSIVSKANRRKTIADLPLASTEPPTVTRSTSRRMSAASSIGSVNGDRSVSRASSVVPGRKSVTPAPGPASNGVQVKKARGTSAASRAPKMEPPVPRVPSNYMSKTASAKEKDKDKDKVKDNDMDQLTTGLKRITLKLPSKEEYEAREKQKALEAAERKAAPKTTSRKAPAARTTKAPARTTVTKKPVGRPPKSSKPPSPVEATPQPAPVSKPVEHVHSPEPPKVENAAITPLEQPQPLPPRRGSLSMAMMDTGRRTSTEPINPPAELAEMNITPDQLPKPSVLASVEPVTVTTSPPRPDTPPPPPPSIPQFVNYTTTTFGSATTVNPIYNQVTKPENQEPLQWLPPNTDAVPRNTTASGQPMSPSSKRQELPVFAANGRIPFAPMPNTVSNMSMLVPPTQPVVGGTTSTTGGEIDIWEVPDTPAR